MKPCAKRVATLYCAKRVAAIYLAGGGVEKTDSGKWKATKGDESQYFDDKDKAQAWVKGDGESKKDSDKPTGFAKKLLSMGKKVGEALKKLPENTQKFIGDKEFRDKATKEMVKAATEKPKHFALHAIDHFKHEVHEVSGAISAIAKGEKPTRDQLKACAGLAIEVGLGIAAVSTAGASAGAGVFLKGVVKHTILSTISGGLGDAYVFGYGGTKILGEIMRLAAEEEKDEKENKDKKDKKGDKEEVEKFAEELVKFVTKALENGISDEVMEKAVKEMAGESKEASAEKVALLWLNK